MVFTRKNGDFHGRAVSFREGNFWIFRRHFQHPIVVLSECDVNAISQGSVVEMKFQSGTLIFSSCSNVAAFLLRMFCKGKLQNGNIFDTCRRFADDSMMKTFYLGR